MKDYSVLDSLKSIDAIRLETAYDLGYARGYDDGHTQGYADGQADTPLQIRKEQKS